MAKTEPAEAPRVLVVDDHESVRVALAKSIEQRGWRAEAAENGRQALDRVRHGRVDLVVADLKMPGMDGLELLKNVKVVSPRTEVVMITAYGTVERAVEAMKLGAVDFVVKPFKRAVLMGALDRALGRQCGVVAEVEAPSCPEIVGKSRIMRDVVHLLTRIAPSSATVLICGESGTGKELVADAIHRLSARANGPLVKVSCAALPETLLESEIFGHERGAFTGAVDQRKGRFEVADGGTLFLDEITQLSDSMQAKLLRVLQDGGFQRLGSSETRTADVRVIAATNMDLKDAVDKGRFREDLYYRVNVVTLRLPPLRERPDDIPVLADFFAERFGERDGKKVLGITREAMDCLAHSQWPGNVRELENVIERAVILARGDRIGVDDLPDWMTGASGKPRQVSIPVGTSLRDAERRIIEATLRHTEGDKSAAAGMLGITRRTIYRRLGEREDERADESNDR